MTVRFLPAAERVAVPWKNGGGVTREIVGSPEGAGMDDFAWRVSLADVGADGPFSAFDGVERILTLVEGAGMDLTVGGARRIVDTRYVPQNFPGDLPTDCRLLAGPVVNLNVMWRRGGDTAPTVTLAPPGRPLGRVSKVPSGPRRLARRLAALSGSSAYAQYADDPPPCDAPHQTPQAPPSGRTTLLSKHALAVPAGPAVVVVALDGTAEVADLALAPYDAVLLTGEDAVLHTVGRAAVIDLAPRGRHH